MGEFPNKETQFKAGESGNPKGKPKGIKNRSTVARTWLEAKKVIVNPLTKLSEELTMEDIITLMQIKQAAEGDTAAYKALLDSAYGAPKQNLEMTGEEGGPIETVTVFQIPDNGRDAKH